MGIDSIDPATLTKLIDANLHQNFYPHDGQIEIGRAVLLPPYGRGIRRAFIRCGRKFGKSSFAVYLSFWFALRYPGSPCYLLAPLYKQAKEIYWATNLVQEFLNIKGEQSPFIKNIDNQDTRVELINGSFVKVDGSDNYASQRGWNPMIVVADEFAEFHPRWLPMMTPNLASRNATLVLIGTPPEFPINPDGTKHQYVTVDERYQRETGKGKAFWIHRPSITNTAVFSKPEMVQWLEDEKARLYEEGMGFIFEREYNAQIVQGGQYAIFPQFNNSEHVTDHSTLIELVSQDPDRYEWYCGADPGTRSVFGVLFIAYDKYSGTPYFLDELYQRGSQNCTVDVVMPAILEKVNELYPRIDKWNFFSDSAAAWFIEEAAQRYNIGFSPTIKRVGDKEDGIALIRDLFRTRNRFISDRCFSLATELVNYSTDEKGRIPKSSDHLIDIVRYFCKLAGITLSIQGYTPKKKTQSPAPRGYTTRWQDEEIDISNYILTPDYEYLKVF